MWDISAKYRQKKNRSSKHKVHKMDPTTTVFYLKHTPANRPRSRYSIRSRPHNRHILQQYLR